MPALTHRPNPLQRLVQRMASTRPGASFLAQTLHHLDRPVLRLTDGRFSFSNLLAGLPTVLMTTIGAKSRRPRTSPLVGIADGDNVVIIGTNFGRSFLPGWYYNLRANPEAALLTPRGTGTYVAREATEAERDLYWKRAVEIYTGYENYKRRIGERFIPIFVLTPKAG